VDTPGGPVRALLPPVNVPGREAIMGAVPALGQHGEAIKAELRSGADHVPVATVQEDSGDHRSATSTQQEKAEKDRT
jgi:hypothetical protein